MKTILICTALMFLVIGTALFALIDANRNATVIIHAANRETQP